MPFLAKLEKSSALSTKLYQYLASSETSSSSELSSGYYEYIPPEEKILGIGLKLLTPKQMFQRLTIVLAQVKAGNTSKYLVTEIFQIIYYLYWAEVMLKKSTII